MARLKASRSEEMAELSGPRYHVHFTPTSSSWLNQIELALDAFDAKYGTDTESTVSLWNF